MEFLDGTHNAHPDAHHFLVCASMRQDRVSDAMLREQYETCEYCEKKLGEKRSGFAIGPGGEFEKLAERVKAERGWDLKVLRILGGDGDGPVGQAWIGLKPQTPTYRKYPWLR